jgi:ribosomal protein S18 acetylase RimI-like enzyme
MGVHPDFRHQALGRAALTETVRRLQLQGAEIIHVETDSYRNAAFRLYESLGFSISREVLVYRKDYEKG